MINRRKRGEETSPIVYKMLGLQLCPVCYEERKVLAFEMLEKDIKAHPHKNAYDDYFVPFDKPLPFMACGASKQVKGLLCDENISHSALMERLVRGTITTH